MSTNTSIIKKGKRVLAAGAAAFGLAGMLGGDVLSDTPNVGTQVVKMERSGTLNEYIVNDIPTPQNIVYQTSMEQISTQSEIDHEIDKQHAGHMKGAQIANHIINTYIDSVSSLTIDKQLREKYINNMRHQTGSAKNPAKKMKEITSKFLDAYRVLVKNTNTGSVFSNAYNDILNRADVDIEKLERIGIDPIDVSNAKKSEIDEFVKKWDHADINIDSAVHTSVIDDLTNRIIHVNDVTDFYNHLDVDYLDQGVELKFSDPVTDMANAFIQDPQLDPKHAKTKLQDAYNIAKKRKEMHKFKLATIKRMEQLEADTTGIEREFDKIDITPDDDHSKYLGTLTNTMNRIIYKARAMDQLENETEKFQISADYDENTYKIEISKLKEKIENEHDTAVLESYISQSVLKDGINRALTKAKTVRDLDKLIGDIDYESTGIPNISSALSKSSAQIEYNAKHIGAENKKFIKKTLDELWRTGVDPDKMTSVVNEMVNSKSSALAKVKDVKVANNKKTNISLKQLNTAVRALQFDEKDDVLSSIGYLKGNPKTTYVDVMRLKDAVVGMLIKHDLQSIVERQFGEQYPEGFPWNSKKRTQEEAEREAQEEAERKAQEEADRKAQEEAKRKAQEEAERKAQEEEAERKAHEEEAERFARFQYEQEQSKQQQKQKGHDKEDDDQNDENGGQDEQQERDQQFRSEFNKREISETESADETLENEKQKKKSNERTLEIVPNTLVTEPPESEKQNPAIELLDINSLKERERDLLSQYDETLPKEKLHDIVKNLANVYDELGKMPLASTEVEKNTKKKNIIALHLRQDNNPNIDALIKSWVREQKVELLRAKKEKTQEAFKRAYSRSRVSAEHESIENVTSTPTTTTTPTTTATPTTSSTFFHELSKVSKPSGDEVSNFFKSIRDEKSTNVKNQAIIANESKEQDLYQNHPSSVINEFQSPKHTNDFDVNAPFTVIRQNQTTQQSLNEQTVESTGARSYNRYLDSNIKSFDPSRTPQEITEEIKTKNKSTWDDPLEPISLGFDFSNIISSAPIEIQAGVGSRGAAESSLVDDVFLKPPSRPKTVHTSLQATPDQPQQLPERDEVSKQLREASRPSVSSIQLSHATHTDLASSPPHEMTPQTTSYLKNLIPAPNKERGKAKMQEIKRRKVETVSSVAPLPTMVTTLAAPIVHYEPIRQPPSHFGVVDKDDPFIYRYLPDWKRHDIVRGAKRIKRDKTSPLIIDSGYGNKPNKFVIFQDDANTLKNVVPYTVGISRGHRTFSYTG